MSITYTIGDATSPSGSGHKIIVHVCNDLGGWGAGFVLALSKKWPAASGGPEAVYREAFKTEPTPQLGEMQLVAVENDVSVANIIGQHKVRTRAQPDYVPVRYDAIRDGLALVAEEAIRLKASVHMPRIGCGLAGGSWDQIEPLIEETLCERNIPVTVYDLS